MTKDIEYGYLFAMMRRIIKNVEEFNASCHCGDCAYVKRARIYFKMFKSNVDTVERFCRICDLLIDEEKGFMDNFIVSVLSAMNEDAEMERVFNLKEDQDNNTYLFNCNTLMAVKKFKSMMKQKI